MATVNFHGAKEGQLSPLFPFGPMVLYAKLPMNLVRRLNKYTNKTIKDEKKAEQLDHSHHLVGKLKQEFLIESEEDPLDSIFSCVADKEGAKNKFSYCSKLVPRFIPVLELS